MEQMLERCAGLDVHKKTVMACVLRPGKRSKAHKEFRRFGTMTRDILELADWLSQRGVVHVAMESTGVFWKPIYNILEGSFELMLCNARHIKQVPGRKTDVSDSEWIAQLLQHGLLQGSFVPPRPMRELRELTRHRATLTDEKTRVGNRIHKILEDSNIKLGSVASDVLGVSGRAIIRAIINGEDDPGTLAELSRRRLRGKIPELRTALQGHVTDHHRFMLESLMDHLTFLEGKIESLSARIETTMDSISQKPSPGEGEEFPPLPFRDAVQLLKDIPGVQQITAENVLAEIGTDMSQFPSSGNLASWSGICPGNDESAGKRRKGKTTKGNRWLRRALNQAAWAASHTRGTYFSTQYRRIASRRGKKRAIVAVAHSLLVTIYHMIRDQTIYADLGADHFDRLDPDRLTLYYLKRLKSLGHKVTLESESDVA